MDTPGEYPNRFAELKSMADRMFNTLSDIFANGTYDKQRDCWGCPSCQKSWEFGKRHTKYCDLERVLGDYRRF